MGLGLVLGVDKMTETTPFIQLVQRVLSRQTLLLLSFLTPLLLLLFLFPSLVIIYVPSHTIMQCSGWWCKCKGGVGPLRGILLEGR